MSPEDFVRHAKAHRDEMLETYFDPTQPTAVSIGIAALQLDDTQLDTLRGVIGIVLTDTFYTWLLALDGCANFGGVQQMYQLSDESGHVLTGEGELEAHAWEYFHGAETD